MSLQFRSPANQEQRAAVELANVAGSGYKVCVFMDLLWDDADYCY